MYFQVMTPNDMNAEYFNKDTSFREFDTSSWEIELERIRNCIVEVRTQDLTHVFYHLQDFKEVQEASYIFSLI